MINLMERDEENVRLVVEYAVPKVMLVKIVDQILQQFFPDDEYGGYIEEKLAFLNRCALDGRIRVVVEKTSLSKLMTFIAKISMIIKQGDKK